MPTPPTPVIFNRFMLVPAGPNVPNVVNSIVEIPKGKRNKFEIDKETGLIKLDRYLYSALFYPGDYGIIPQTLAEDDDPLDILVMVNESTFSGCLIEARPIGLFKMTDRDVNDYKILAVPASDPLFDDYHDLWRIPPHFLREVEHFFATYKQLEESNVKTYGWEPAAIAHEEILTCMKRYEDHQKAKTKTTTRKKSTTRKKTTASKKNTRKKVSKKSK